MNKFNMFLGISLSVLLVLGSVSLSFADIPNPRQQLAEGIEPENIQCKEGQVLVFRINAQKHACVFENTASIWETHGISEIVNRFENTIRNFEECVDAGNPVMESYPRQCSSSDGQTFVEEISMQETGCPIDSFLDVSDFDGAGNAYPTPFLKVYCDEQYLNVESNGIPHYTFVQTTPNALSEQDYLWTISLEPQIASQTSEIPLLGVVGFAINGLPIYGPNEGPFPDPYGDPVYNGILDNCLGHTAQRGDYHYHAFLLSCLSLAAGDYQESPILGYALDGFPIYGSYGCIDNDCSEIIEFQSSWVQTGDPTTYAWDNHEYVQNDDPKYLDECNGRYDEKLGYHYRATKDFPYILGCYAGEIDDTLNSLNPNIPNQEQPPTGNPPQGGPPPGSPPPPR